MTQSLPDLVVGQWRRTVGLARSLNEYIACLTWPLRGREQVNALKQDCRQIQYERLQVEGLLKGEIAALAHQVDHLWQKLDNMSSLRDELHENRRAFEANISSLTEELHENRRAFEALRFGSPAIAVSDYGPLVVKSGDLIGEHLRSGRLWDKHLVPVIAESARAGAIAIDAGAHFGTVSAILSDYFDVVHAFEANFSVFKYLLSNACFYRKGKIIPHNIALFDHETRMSLAAPSDQDLDPPMAETLEERFQRITNTGSLRFSENGCDVNVVSARTLDSFAFTNVGFIKIDCQGADGRIIKGAEATISACRPIVVFEWEMHLAESYGVPLAEIKELFGRLNYSVELLFEHNQKQRDYVARPKL